MVQKASLVPLPLALQILNPGMYFDGTLQVWLGKLPDNLPIELPILGQGQVVGGLQQGKRFRILTHFPHSLLQLQIWYSNKLRALNWLQWKSQNDVDDFNLFLTSNRNHISKDPFIFCTLSRSFTLTLHFYSESADTTYIKFTLNSGTLNCSLCQEEWVKNSFNLLPLPQLIPPAVSSASESVLRNYSLNNYAGGSERNWYSELILHTSLNIHELSAHYDSELVHAGWSQQTSNIQDRMSWSVWALRNWHNLTLQLFLVFVSDSSDPNAYIASLRLLTVQEYSNELSYESIHALKEEEEIPEEVLWQMLTDDFSVDERTRQLWIGRMPPSLPNQLRLSEQIQVLGSITEEDNYIELFLKVDLPSVQACEFLAVQLINLGWWRRDDSSNQSAFEASQFQDCHASFIHLCYKEYCTIMLTAITNNCTNVTLVWRKIAEDDASWNTDQLVNAEELAQENIPTLSLADQTQVLINRGVQSGQEFESIVNISTALPTAILVNHYQVEMQKAGWQQQTVSEKNGCHFSLWYFIDKQGQYKEGILGFLVSPENCNQYIGYFKSIRPR